VKVDTEKCLTVDEELEYIERQLDLVGNFFRWDVHPNKARAADISAHRLLKKLVAVRSSPEYFYQRDVTPYWLPEVLDKIDPYKE